MSSQPIEIEGDWKRITNEAARYKKHRLRLTVLPEIEKPEPALQARPIAEVLAEIASQVPVEEQAKIPRDFCDQLDHYIYGTPKR